MTLRLVLVSLVAALGLTIPGAPMIESWVASTQNWMNARFADWDTRNPQDTDFVVVSDYYDAGQFASRPAVSNVPAAPAAPSITSTERSEALGANATSTLSNKPATLPDVRPIFVHSVSFTRKTPVFEPIEVAERIGLGPAEQLNRMSDGIGVVPPRVLRTLTRSSSFEPITLARYLYQGIGVKLEHLKEGLSSVQGRVARWVAAKRTVQPIRVFEDLYGGSAPRRDRKIEVVAVKPAPQVLPALHATEPLVMSFGPMESCPTLYFAGALNQPAPKPAVTQAPTVKTVITATKVATTKPAPTAKIVITATKVATTTPTPTAKPVVTATKVAVTKTASAPKPVVAASTLTTTKTASAPKPVLAAPKVATTAPTPAAKPVVTSPKVATTRPAPAVRTASAPSVVKESADDLDLETGSISPIDDGFGAFTVHAAIRTSNAAGAPRFEPLVAEARSVGVAQELNRRYDGHCTPAPSNAKAGTPSASVSRASPDLSRAVRLTREALFAWVNVFTGPKMASASQPKQSL
jgi:hypothetical protein